MTTTTRTESFSSQDADEILVLTTEVDLVSPAEPGLETQRDANVYFKQRIQALEAVTVIDGGTY